MFRIIAATFLLGAAVPASTQEGQDSFGPVDLYRITMLRAAPGQWYHLKEAIETLGEAGSFDEYGCTIPLRIRHSQGDQWDFMLLQPVESYEAYFVNGCEKHYAWKELSAHADFFEDWFARGPEHDEFFWAASSTGLFHLEMFKARAGMKDALYNSRVRENAIFTGVGANPNFVWVGELGSNYDVMTIGMHKNWASYAEHNAAGTDEEWEEFSRKYGYDGAGDLAPQLRSFLISHNDSFAVSMK